MFMIMDYFRIQKAKKIKREEKAHKKRKHGDNDFAPGVINACMLLRDCIRMFT